MIVVLPRERAALLVLMSRATGMSNPELSEHGVGLDAGARARLNEAGLVESDRLGRTYRHELTDAGWQWCVAELDVTRPPRSGPSGGALYAVLAGLKRYLDRRDLALSDVFRPDAEAAIRHAYAEAAKPGDWVALVDLRAGIEGVSREDVDAALVAMFGMPGVNLAPEANTKALTEQDHSAAVRIGARDVHMIALARV